MSHHHQRSPGYWLVVGLALLVPGMLLANPVPSPDYYPGPAPYGHWLDWLGWLPHGVLVAVMVLVPLSAEAAADAFLLRRWRHPRRFFGWIMGMHVVTYPLFLGIWLGLCGAHWLIFRKARPFHVYEFLAEGSIVIVEGLGLWYLCTRFRPVHSTTPAPSKVRTILVSLVGNACSFVLGVVLTSR